MTESNLKILFLMIVGLLTFIYWVRAIRPFEKERRERLEKYWTRSCTGTEWRRRFPNASKDLIRDFLESFVDGFAFSSKKRLKFSPDDKIMDVYSSLYPAEGWPDALELETFSIHLEQDYHLNLTNILTDDLTLGQLFLMATEANPKVINELRDLGPCNTHNRNWNITI